MVQIQGKAISFAFWPPDKRHDPVSFNLAYFYVLQVIQGAGNNSSHKLPKAIIPKLVEFYHLLGIVIHPIIPINNM
jgi:hypothetical protein